MDELTKKVVEAGAEYLLRLFRGKEGFRSEETMAQAIKAWMMLVGFQEANPMLTKFWADLEKAME